MNITINVDVYNDGKFTYKDQTGAPAEHLTLVAGDFVTWKVKLKGRRVHFQVTFDKGKLLSPFGETKEIRSSRRGETDPLEVTTKHSGEGMWYTVTLPNGWSNDPEAFVEPTGFDPKTAAVAPVEIRFQSDGTDITFDPASSTVQPLQLVVWKSASGRFKIHFTDKSPFSAKDLDSGMLDKLSSKVRKDADALDYPYTVTTLDVTGEGTSILTVPQRA